VTLNLRHRLEKALIRNPPLQQQLDHLTPFFLESAHQ
jgi:hypothetical protein